MVLCQTSSNQTLHCTYFHVQRAISIKVLLRYVCHFHLYTTLFISLFSISFPLCLSLIRSSLLSLFSRAAFQYPSLPLSLLLIFPWNDGKMRSFAEIIQNVGLKLILRIINVFDSEKVFWMREIFYGKIIWKFMLYTFETAYNKIRFFFYLLLLK